MTPQASAVPLPRSRMNGGPGETCNHRLKILFLVDELESISAGGSERQVLQLIDILRRSGHEAGLAVFRKSAWLKAESKTFPIYFCELNSVLSPSGFAGMRQLVKWMREQKFQVVQTMFREANLLGPALARMAGIPVVLGSRRNLNHAMSRQFALLQSVSNLFATRLVANSECVKRTVARREFTAPEKIDVIYNGVDTQYFAPQPQFRMKTRQTLGISETAMVVGVISRFGPIKGQDVFLNAAAKIVDDPQTHFVMVGDGPTREAIRSLAQRLKIDNRCLFVPAQRDIRPYLAALDIAVLPSRSEGFSNSLLEYMSAGLAIVATDVGGNRESLGDTGILVPPEDPEALARAIAGLTSDNARRESLGIAARARACTFFDVSAAQARIAEYFESLAERYRLASARISPPGRS